MSDNYLDTHRQGEQNHQMDDSMRGAACGAGSAIGAQWAHQQAQAQADYIDPLLLGHSTPNVVTYEQYQRLQQYDGWDGDMRWPHPQFTKDEAERARNYNNRPNVGYMRDQAQISAYERQIAENQAATRQLNGQGGQPQGGSRPGLPPMRDVFGRR